MRTENIEIVGIGEFGRKVCKNLKFENCFIYDGRKIDSRRCRIVVSDVSRNALFVIENILRKTESMMTILNSRYEGKFGYTIELVEGAEEKKIEIVSNALSLLLSPPEEGTIMVSDISDFTMMTECSRGLIMWGIGDSPREVMKSVRESILIQKGGIDLLTLPGQKVSRASRGLLVIKVLPHVTMSEVFRSIEMLDDILHPSAPLKIGLAVVRDMQEVAKKIQLAVLYGW